MNPRMNPRHLLTRGNVLGAALIAVLLVLPQLATAFFVNFVMTQTLILGLAAATIVFLATYGGMTSLAQFLLFGVAGFMFGNAAQEAGSRGLNLGWSPWVAVAFALLVTLAAAFVLGAIASRTTGLYFLMLTMVYAVIGYFVFAQIVEISGPGGITSIQRPDLLGPPVRLYYAGVLLSVLAYLGFRAVGRTAFGLALQGVRDDPVRMASLGFNVRLHRTLAFTLAGFVAGLSGLLNVWWNGQIDPASIATGPTLILLIIAVIGGITSFAGAWLGAFVYVWVFTYLRDLPLIDNIGITEARFNTVIGVIVLVIMVLSPEGLTGIVKRLRHRVGARTPAMPGPASGGSPSVGKRTKELGGTRT
ncbi:branched-chain amino acid ABC transporter permease [Streptomyces radicis]|uniref:Branched-chain amino acid ABC transporter permease n=1 Tax=Streptomyces radicis TaxID=1750517 RepID=A0A3A9WCW4_9ACTN|nr:branched-chain amino acid ABC transporter permease [Streptomyces radicis]RKN10619.1 branched-chain amino acid ABC transporter permease [Streptomyces radicis]RKN24879.1 branched-chain amino acid ABC transporter permease [Streptomyces radicis]